MPREMDGFYMVPYLECSKCGYVQNEMLNWTATKKPCSRCKKVSRIAYLWPGGYAKEGVAADIYYTLIQDLEFETSAKRSISAILLCAMAEYLLGQLCYRLIRFQNGSKQHAKIIMSRADARWKLNQLLEELTGKKLSEVMSETKNKPFYDSYMQIVGLRNDFAHGDPEAPGDLVNGALKQRIHTFEVCQHKMISAFVDVHNLLMTKPI